MFGLSEQRVSLWVPRGVGVSFKMDENDATFLRSLSISILVSGRVV